VVISLPSLGGWPYSQISVSGNAKSPDSDGEKSVAYTCRTIQYALKDIDEWDDFSNRPLPGRKSEAEFRQYDEKATQVLRSSTG